MRKDEKINKKLDNGIHPGAFTEIYDENNELLDTVNSADDVFTRNIPGHKKRANHASPAVGDPPVPNRAHTGI
jgi:hypothetical protein